MEDLAAFNVRKAKRVAAEERDEHSSAEGSQSQSNELSENSKKGMFVGIKVERLEKLVGDQNPGPEVRPMSKRGRGRREQMICQKMSDG